VPNIGTIKNSFVTVPADALITVQLSFKDGKAKYEVVNQNIYNSQNKGELGKVTFKGSKWSGFPIYDEKNNNLRQEQLKKDIENYYNSQIAKIKEQEIEKAKNRINNITPREIQIIERLANGIVNQWLHQPIINLKHLAGKKMDEVDCYIRAVNDLWNLNAEVNNENNN